MPPGKPFEQLRCRNMIVFCEFTQSQIILCVIAERTFRAAGRLEVLSGLGVFFLLVGGVSQDEIRQGAVCVVSASPGKLIQGSPRGGGGLLQHPLAHRAQLGRHRLRRSPGLAS